MLTNLERIGVWVVVLQGEESKRKETNSTLEAWIVPDMFLLSESLTIYLSIYLFIFQFSDIVMLIVIFKEISVFGNSL